MSFLVLMLTIMLEKLSHVRQEIQKDGWWFSLLKQASRLFTQHAWLALICALLVALLPLAALFYFSSSVFYGLLLLPLHLVIVLYSIGRTDIKNSLGSFRDAWRRQDKAGATLAAERDLKIQAENDKQLFIQVQQYMTWKAYQGFFSIIFYYCIFGPLAALAYRLLVLSQDQQQFPAISQKANYLLHSLDWIPVRLLSLSFALMGNFSAVSKSLIHDVLNLEISGPNFINQSARCAADVEEEQEITVLDSLWQLLVRSAVFWYTIIAFITLYSF